MKERPIIFSGPLIPRLIDGTKTQTRRVAKLPKGLDWSAFDRVEAPDDDGPSRLVCYRGQKHPVVLFCPHGSPGTRLWVRETWQIGKTYRDAFNGDYDIIEWADPIPKTKPTGYDVAYRSDDDCSYTSWRSPLHMPRWASRITLEITDVRVERVQSITTGGYLQKSDVQREGCPFENDPALLGQDEAQWFADLWDSIHGPGAWERNDWCWCISFKRIDGKN